MRAFISDTPSVFVIGSPFQAMCLVSTIFNLDIKDYKVVVIHTDRFGQVESVLKKYEVPFTLVYVGWHRWKMRFYRILSLLHKKSRYTRLFVGDYRSCTLLYFGLQYVADGSDIVYLDDGNATIPLFEDKAQFLMTGIDAKVSDLISRRKHMELMKYFYSIYEGYHNNKYVIEYNSLSCLCRHSSNEAGNKAYIIGPKIAFFCKRLGIEENVFLATLERVINDLKNRYGNVTVTYIPHGKDTTELAKEFCFNNNIEYYKLSEPVELYLLKEKRPLAVFGFGSSALYNIKKMFPSSEVYTVRFGSVKNEKKAIEKETVIEYYRRNGIIQVDYNI